MKLSAKKGASAFLALIIIAVGAVVSARVFFEYDIFDRGGWYLTDNGGYQYRSYWGEPMLGWQEIGGEYYYFLPEQDGKMATGWMETTDGRYYFREDGRRVSGWAVLEDEYYYFGEDGVMWTGWVDSDAHRYYLNDNGSLYTGWLDTDEGRFYFGKNGAMQTGWVSTGDGLYYLSETGAVSKGWVDTDKGRYYINEDGSAHKGWLEVEDNQYFLNEDGTLHTGWLDTEEGRYYFYEDGRMAVGRVMIDGIARHFTSSGKYIVVVNRWNPVPDDYEYNLVPFDGFQVDAECQESLAQMIADCRAAGFVCNISSAYRGYNYQHTIFQRKVDKLMATGKTLAEARNETARSIAIPGTSEHQLGLAVDLKSAYSTYGWLAQNSWKYGYILRYPNGATSLTGIYYEPWHFRYVGKELAAELFDLNLCLEAYMDRLTEQAAK